jgi:Pentapeptide repeats (8 copies)
MGGSPIDFTEHVETVLQRKKLYEWLADHPDDALDLRGENLSGQILSATNLRRANLEGANLSQAVLVGANLGAANLRHASLTVANLEGAMLAEADLRGADLRQDWKLFDGDRGIDSAREIREYFIPDFSNWKDHDSYAKAFERLLRDLKAWARDGSSA